MSEAIILLFRLLLMIVSNLGLWELLRRKTKVSVYFIPSLVVALQTSVLFIGGIWNLLLETTVLTAGFGAAYLIGCLWREKNLRFFRNYLNIGYLFLTAVTVLSAVALRGSIFTHYDDFSHWGLVVIQMLLNDRFPNFQDVLTFKEYPIGSSIYVYCFCRLLGSSESLQMTAQAYVMTACILPLFGFCKKNSLPALLCMVGMTSFFFTYNIALSSLLVDTLLSVVSACALLYMHQYCNRSSERVEFYLAGAYLVQVVQIKNSGVFFVLIAAAWVVYRAVRERIFKQRVILMLMPLISFILWHAHCRYVFDDARFTKHAMHPKYYRNIVLQKSAADFLTIPKNVFLFVTGYKDLWMIIGFFLILGAAVFFFSKECKAMWCRLSLFCGGVFLVYQIGLILMYLFSMPNYEASNLAEIDRYEKSILVFVLYMILPVCMKLLNFESKKRAAASAVSAGMIAIAFAFPFLFTGQFSLAWCHTELTQTESGRERIWVEQQMKKYSIPSGSSYCILLPRGDGGYADYMCIYLLNSKEITSSVIEDPEQLNRIDARYILIYDETNELIKNWIIENYPDQVGRSVIIRQPQT